MKKIKNIIFIALGIVIFIISIRLFIIFIAHNMIISIIDEDRSLNREKMYYDLGEGYNVTVMLKDSLAYIMPYMYKGKELPTEDYYVILRSDDDSETGGRLIFTDSKNIYLILGSQQLKEINFKRYDYSCYYYESYPYNEAQVTKKSGNVKYSYRDSIKMSELKDSLKQKPSFFVSYMGKPFIVDVERVNNGEIELFQYRGYKEKRYIPLRLK